MVHRRYAPVATGLRTVRETRIPRLHVDTRAESEHAASGAAIPIARGSMWRGSSVTLKMRYVCFQGRAWEPALV